MDSIPVSFGIASPLGATRFQATSLLCRFLQNASLTPRIPRYALPRTATCIVEWVEWLVVTAVTVLTGRGYFFLHKSDAGEPGTYIITVRSACTTCRPGRTGRTLRAGIRGLEKKYLALLHGQKRADAPTLVSLVLLHPRFRDQRISAPQTPRRFLGNTRRDPREKSCPHADNIQP